MPGQRAFKLRSFVNGKAKNGREYVHYALTVPTEIAERIPPTMTFVPKLTEEGILFEPKQQIEEHIELPDWLKDESSENGNGAGEKAT